MTTRGDETIASEVDREGAKTGTSVTLQVRSLSPSGCRERQDAVVDRLRGLESRGAIDRFDVRVGGANVPVDGPVATTDGGRAALRRVARFDRWARAAGVSLAFHTCEVASTVTDEYHREVRFPTMVLAEFQEEDLLCVTPHTVDDGVRTVTDRLDALEGDENPTKGVRGRVERAASTIEANE